MKVLTTDNEKSPLNILNRTILEVVPDAELKSFTSAIDAVQEIEQHGFRPDIAFLDIEMPEMNGLQLAGRIKQDSPATWLVFVTGYSQYALQAFSVHANGYLLKPVSADQLRSEFEQLGYKPILESKSNCVLRIQCFGNFEVFCHGEVVDFKRNKAKELFAYLIHKRGTECSTRELASVLFEDAPYTRAQQSYMQTIIMTLCHTLADCGADDVVIRRFGYLSIDTSRVDCDYYRFLDLEPAAVNSYLGEYMAQYSWSEFTVGYLNQKKKQGS